jgi:hypothetical protein
MTLFVFVLLTTPLAFYGFFWMLDKDFTSFYRYRLWRIRDELKAEVLSGSLPNVPCVNYWLSIIESEIYSANKTSFLYFWFLPRPPRFLMEEMNAKKNDGKQYLSVAQLNSLQSYRDRLLKAVFEQCLYFKPSGWFILLIIIPSLLIRKFKGEVLKYIEPKLNRRIDEDSLAAYAA